MVEFLFGSDVCSEFMVQHLQFYLHFTSFKNEIRLEVLLCDERTYVQPMMVSGRKFSQYIILHDSSLPTPLEFTSTGL